MLSVYILGVTGAVCLGLAIGWLWGNRDGIAVGEARGRVDGEFMSRCDARCSYCGRLVCTICGGTGKEIDGTPGGVCFACPAAHRRKRRRWP